MHEGSRRAIVAAFMANLGIAVAKFAGFAVTGAASMLAESIHSLADTGNQGLLFLGGSRANRRADEAHPFGHGRERYFWAFVVAVILFSMGSLFALFEGEEKLRHPHALESVEWAVAILLVAIILEAFSFRTAIREARHVKGDESWWRFIRQAKAPELPVVLLEDLGALIGLCFALAGVGLAEVTGTARWDAVGSLAIGILLGVIAVILATEMKSLLIGEAASPEQLRAIEHAITASPRVRRLIHMRTEHVGPDQILVAAKVELDPDLSFGAVVDTVNQIEATVRAAVPGARYVYLEPDAMAEPSGTTPAAGGAGRPRRHSDER